MLKKPIFPTAWLALFFFGALMFVIAVWASSTPAVRQQQSQMGGVRAPESKASGVSRAESTDDRLARYTLWVAVFTCVLAVSTGALWWVTWRGSVRQSKEMKILERAHLVVEPTGVDPFTAPWSVAKYGIRNVGRMPARDVEWTMEAEISNDGRRNDFPLDWGKISGKWVLAPGANMNRRYEFLLTEEQVVSFRRGPDVLYVWGEVRYTDGFGNGRWTKFCHRYGLGRNVRVPLGYPRIPREHGAYHQWGNDTDDG